MKPRKRKKKKKQKKHANWYPKYPSHPPAPYTHPTHILDLDDSIFGHLAAEHLLPTCQALLSESDSFTIIVDSGASLCMSGDKSDFIGPIHKVNGAKVSGIVNKLTIEGCGMVKWSVMDTKVKLQDLVLSAYYVPKVKQRLLSTSVLCTTYDKSKVCLDSLSWTIQLDPTLAPIDVFINPINNLPTLTGYHREAVTQFAANYSRSLDTTHANNTNLTEPQKELVRWHNRLGHVNFQTVQFLMRSGSLASTQSLKNLHTRASKLYPGDLPKCAACQFGKQTSRPVPGQITKTVQD